jgi:hypothetical protein
MNDFRADQFVKSAMLCNTKTCVGIPICGSWTFALEPHSL